ncbi:MAG: tripartite tricarboxylate transporter substrate binding protein [Betaproteobacteria bacterium]|nr:tripartite tricarboxylate transporter substrate binding protein [Betaproteobacteria bacterium]
MHKTKRISSLLSAAVLAAAGLAALAPAVVQAQAFPNKPLRLVIPFPPGGPTDVYGRAYAARLSSALGQPVIVDNKAGASGAIGAMDIKRSAPDGYSLIFGTASTNCLYSLLQAAPQYDPVTDFSPVALVGGSSLVIIASASLPPTLKEIVDSARKEPGKLQYGSPGTGTLMQLTVERMRREVGNVDILHVPYKGSAPSLQALMGSQIALSIDTLGQVVSHHKGGKIRAVALTAAKRSPLLPDVPTLDEAIGTKGFEASLWNVVAAPAGTPAAVINALSAATNKAMGDAALREQFASQGIDVIANSTPEGALAYIKAEQQRWKPVIDAAGIRNQ